ncbi:hypothetical protein EJB05_03032 [Eragrostis curvula]|uniref:Uncharacterized protein n=1 Tax=Eragrostis curvula TaxID=38414 RepID=A0A5J9WXU1_9POAL|nr:hypothetical protein EJB05_03032 [Eragrostis curvula]
MEREVHLSLPAMGGLLHSSSISTDNYANVDAGYMGMTIESPNEHICLCSHWIPINIGLGVVRRRAKARRIPLVHDDAMVPPPLQVVVVQADDHNKPDDCSVVPHADIINSPNAVSATVLGEDESLVEDADRSISSHGSWRVEKVVLSSSQTRHLRCQHTGRLIHGPTRTQVNRKLIEQIVRN